MEFDPQEVRARMSPGQLSDEGFLGSDERDVARIIAVDRLEMVRLGLDPEALGRRLAALTALALSKMGAEVTFDGLCLTSVEVRGAMACPFGEEGIHPKAFITARKTGTGEVLEWSALAAHLARDHGFYGGRGSVSRMEPGKAARFFNLVP